MIWFYICSVNKVFMNSSMFEFLYDYEIMFFFIWIIIQCNYLFVSIGVFLKFISIQNCIIFLEFVVVYGVFYLLGLSVEYCVFDFFDYFVLGRYNFQVEKRVVMFFIFDFQQVIFFKVLSFQVLIFRFSICKELNIIIVLIWIEIR